MSGGCIPCPTGFRPSTNKGECVKDEEEAEAREEDEKLSTKEQGMPEDIEILIWSTFPTVFVLVISMSLWKLIKHLRRCCNNRKTIDREIQVDEEEEDDSHGNTTKIMSRPIISPANNGIPSRDNQSAQSASAKYSSEEIDLEMICYNKAKKEKDEKYDIEEEKTARSGSLEDESHTEAEDRRNPFDDSQSLGILNPYSCRLNTVLRDTEA